MRHGLVRSGFDMRACNGSALADHIARRTAAALRLLPSLSPINVEEKQAIHQSLSVTSARSTSVRSHARQIPQP